MKGFNRGVFQSEGTKRKHRPRCPIRINFTRVLFENAWLVSTNVCTAIWKYLVCLLLTLYHKNGLNEKCRIIAGCLNNEITKGKWNASYISFCCFETVFQSLMKERVLDQIIISTRRERSTPKLSGSVVIKRALWTRYESSKTRNQIF